MVYLHYKPSRRKKSEGLALSSLGSAREALFPCCLTVQASSDGEVERHGIPAWARAAVVDEPSWLSARAEWARTRTLAVLGHAGQPGGTATQGRALSGPRGLGNRRAEASERASKVGISSKPSLPLACTCTCTTTGHHQELRQEQEQGQQPGQLQLSHPLSNAAADTRGGARSYRLTVRTTYLGRYTRYGCRLLLFMGGWIMGLCKPR